MNRPASRTTPALTALPAPNALLAIAATVTLAIAACGSPIPVPATGPHTDDEPMIVPYPPPPARVEVVGPPPVGLEGAVWVDGEYQWKGRRWVWLRGRWEVPYPGAYYAPTATARLGDGRLAWFAGKWHFPEPKAAPKAAPGAEPR